MQKKLVLFFGLLLIAGLLSGCKNAPKTVFDPGKVVLVDAGFIDAIAPLKVTSAAAIHVGGWAADTKTASPASDIIVLADGKQIPFVPNMSISRPDVSKYLNNAALEKVGWDGSIPASSIGIGKHKIAFYAVLSDNTFAVLRYHAQPFCEVEVTE